MLFLKREKGSGAKMAATSMRLYFFGDDLQPNEAMMPLAFFFFFF